VRRATFSHFRSNPAPERVVALPLQGGSALTKVGNNPEKAKTAAAVLIIVEPGRLTLKGLLLFPFRVAPLSQKSATTLKRQKQPFSGGYPAKIGLDRLFRVCDILKSGS